MVFGFECGRNTGKIHLDPFGTDVLKEVFKSFSPRGKPADLRKFVGETDYVSMGAWRDRKGENEIDLVCERPSKAGVRPALDFFEVKRDAARLNMDALKRKAV